MVSPFGPGEVRRHGHRLEVGQHQQGAGFGGFQGNQIKGPLGSDVAGTMAGHTGMP